MVLQGAYCLCLTVEQDCMVQVGALGGILFTKGCYIYVGSALNGLKARLKRHLRSSVGGSGKIHWHIDYLLRNPWVHISSIYIKENTLREECHIAEHVAAHGDPVKKFGCSDCRCVSHLYRVDDFMFLEGVGMHLWVLDS